MRIDYPLPAAHVSPRRLRTGADPVAYFDHHLTQVIARRRFDPARSAVECSGGLDSSTVAQSLAAAVREPVRVGALHIGGPPGEQQLRRRAEMAERAGWGADTLVPMADHLPFAPGGPRAGGALVGVEGAYTEALGVLYSAWRDAGVRWVFTGVAGDELLGLRPEERRQIGDPWRVQESGDWLGDAARTALDLVGRDLAPASVLLVSALQGLATHSPGALRHGLWPVNPLAEPALLRFGESLPLEWRRHKRLLRVRMERLGLSQEVTDPPLRENFGPDLETAMAVHGLPLLDSLMDDSALGRARLLDVAAVRRAARAARGDGALARRLYRPLMLEVAVRSWSRA
ncbi:asparagine synthase-related protein [Streptomyces sp. RFCAC02]|uniref:asparagine synthase-related protein n=1 Tax=Streptomyces sp. RFCAC02 TaxID=2499143 RepID=UPI00143DF496|nr:asparagine synthase-related protein [Streptomyces sp. RFCAC02]